ncbi:autotransporter domain-containing protein [Psychrobacter alimentarius]|uniref:autotransporter domain-containing protein n=1 Tax=Psychrobacter alimentarius TaxID=261164 RepID=UPI00191831A8|nr:autotransporter domain-containing protein [Psychrobacter alimentarius]
MNHVYRVVFNHSLGVYQCVSELAKSRGKSSGKSQVATKLLLTPLAVAMLCVSGSALADVTYDDGATTTLPSNFAVDEVVTVSNGSKVTGSEMVFGFADSAALNVNTAGSVVSNALISLAVQPDSVSVVTVDGAGSSLNAEFLTISEEGQAELTAQNGANVTINDLTVLGLEVSSVANMTLTDKNTVFNGKSILVGDEGQGTLTIKNGAAGKFQSEVGAGIASDSKGQIAITGAGSSLSTDRIIVGDTGEGTLVVNDSAKLTATSDIGVGIGVGSNGTATVDGSGTTATAARIVSGGRGTGLLTISNGAKITSTIAAGTGLVRDSVGTIDVKGTDSVLIAPEITIAQSGNGTLKIQDGAKVTIDASSIIGDEFSGEGLIEVTGNNSTLTSENIIIGNNGQGSLNIVKGAKASANNIVRLGQGIGNNENRVSISDTGSTLDSTELQVGFANSGQLDITKGGKVTAGLTVIGLQSMGRGVINVTDADSALTTDNLSIGGDGRGTLTLSNNGKVEVAESTYLGEGIGAAGSLDISSNSTFATKELVVGNNGSATVNLNSKGVLSTESLVRATTVTSNSVVNFDGGTLRLTADQEALFNGFGESSINVKAGGANIDTQGFNTKVANGAVITGSGDFTKAGKGMLAMATTAKQWTGATNIKKGILRLDGDYTMRDGEILGISLNSLDDYGQLVVTGAADISQGQLQVNASDAVANMTENNEWTDIISASSRTGEFAAINDNSPLVSFEADYSNANAVNLRMVVPVVTPEPPVVTPEPPVVTPEPPVVTPEPPVVTPEPPVVTPEPPVVTPEPPVVTPEPPVVTPEPPVVTPEPPVVTPEPPVSDTTFAQSVSRSANRNDMGIAYALDRAIQDRVTNGDNTLADSLISSTINFSQSQLATAANQLQPLFMGATNRIITDANYAATDAINEHSQTVPQRNLWAQLLGNDSSHDAENGVTGYDAEGYGAIVGLDTPVSNDLNLGVAFSYIKSDADTDGTSLDQELTAKNWQVLGYGNYAVSDATDVNFHAGAGRSDVEGERRIAILTDAVAQSDYSVDTLQAGLGVGHRIGTQQRNVTPFAQLDYARAKSDSYRETGAGVYNLSVDENTYESMRWTAGLRLSQVLTPTFALTGQLAAAVENGDRRSDVTANFISMPNNEFTTIGQEIGNEIGIAGIGLSYTPTLNTKLSVGYRGEWRDNYDSHGANISLQTTF